MIYTLRCQMIAPVSVREAFSVFEDPLNLARITPPSLGFILLTPKPVMANGAILDYQIRWLGLPLRWQTLISEYEPPFFFTDDMKKGPYSYWRHRHTFHPMEEGTLITDTVDYRLPLGSLGVLAHRLTVSHQLKEIFRYRQEALNHLLASGKARWTDPVITAKPPKNPPSETASPETHRREVS